MNRNRICKIGLAALMLFAIGSYIVAVATPFDTEIKIYNSAGVPTERIDALIEHARERGCYKQDLIEKLRKESKWMPWMRAELFIDIGGTPNEVKVHAGFTGGAVYGGGVSFNAAWSGSAWRFSNLMRWVS